MTYNLTIGNQKETNFLFSTDKIADDVSQGNVLNASKKIHSDLFDGGPFTAKGFNHLFSLSDPSSKIAIQKILTNEPVKSKTYKPGKLSQVLGEKDIPTVYKPNGKSYNLVKIEKKISFSAVLGVLEGFPVIGSVIGAIHFLGRLPLMLASYNRLKQASVAYINNDTEKAELENAQKVFAVMIDFSTHQHYLGGSALSIIPGLKPLTRLIQGIIFNCRKPSKPQLTQELRFPETTKPTRENIKQHRKKTIKYDKSQLPAYIPPPRPPLRPKGKVWMCSDVEKTIIKLQSNQKRKNNHESNMRLQAKNKIYGITLSYLAPEDISSKKEKS